MEKSVVHLLADKFRNVAYARGYTDKVVGDIAYRNKHDHIIRLKSTTTTSITVWEYGRGYETIDL